MLKKNIKRIMYSASLLWQLIISLSLSLPSFSLSVLSLIAFRFGLLFFFFLHTKTTPHTSLLFNPSSFGQHLSLTPTLITAAHRLRIIFVFVPISLKHFFFLSLSLTRKNNNNKQSSSEWTFYVFSPLK